MVLSYSKIFSRVNNKISDIKELLLSRDDYVEINSERIHSVIGDIYINRLFSEIEINDTLQELRFSLKKPINDISDYEYVIEILSLGITIEWLRPKVERLEYIIPSLGTKETKKLFGDYKAICEHLKSLEIAFEKKIRNRGYVHFSLE